MSQSINTETRNTNIELLRVLMTIGVVFLHLNYTADSGLLTMGFKGGRWLFSSIMQIMAAPAVNTFLLISGFFLADSERTKISKVIKLLVEVSFFSLLTYLVELIRGDVDLSPVNILMHIIPHNYYITFYVVILCIVPYVVIIVNKLSAMQFKVFVSVVGLLFIVYPFIVSLGEIIVGGKLNGMSSISLEGDGAGYTIVNFLAIFVFGIAVKKGAIKIKHPLILLICSILILHLWKYEIGLGVSQLAFSYNNPVIILMSLCYFMIFKDLKINDIKLIRFLGKISLIVYLIHSYVIHIVGFDWAMDISICKYILFQLVIICICFFSAAIGKFAFDILWKMLMKIKCLSIIDRLEIKV